MHGGLYNQVKIILKDNRFKPKRRLGQSFMVDESIIERMIDYAELSCIDNILDIGAGVGFITEMLASRAESVTAVEVDPILFKILLKRLSKNPKVKLIQQDFLKLQLEDKYDKVIANLPYSVASEILFKLFEEKRCDLGILTLQREFAERLIAREGHRSYGRVTVTFRMLAEIELLEDVPPQAFYPQPKVYSTMIKVIPRRQPLFKVEKMDFFKQIVKLLFTQRRRKVGRALETIRKMNIINSFTKPFLGIPFLDRRVFTLAPEEFGELSDAILQKTNPDKTAGV